MVDLSVLNKRLSSFPTLNAKGDVLLLNTNGEDVLKVGLETIKNLTDRGL